MAGSVGGCASVGLGCPAEHSPPHPSGTRQIHGLTLTSVGGPPLNHFVAPCTPSGCGLTVGPQMTCSSNCPTLSLSTGNLRFPRCPSTGLSETRLAEHQAGEGQFCPSPPLLSAALPYTQICYQSTPGGLLSAPPGARSPGTSFLHPHRLVSNAWSQRSVFASQRPLWEQGGTGLRAPFLPGRGDPAPLHAFYLLEVSLIFLPRWLWTLLPRIEILRQVWGGEGRV